LKPNELLGFDEKTALLVGSVNHSTGQNGVIYNNETFEIERKLSKLNKKR